MKYEEPNMQILLADNEDLVRTSSIKYQEGKFPTGDSSQFPVPNQ